MNTLRFCTWVETDPPRQYGKCPSHGSSADVAASSLFHLSWFAVLCVYSCSPFSIQTPATAVVSSSNPLDTRDLNTSAAACLLVVPSAARPPEPDEEKARERSRQNIQWGGLRARKPTFGTTTPSIRPDMLSFAWKIFF